MKYPESKKWAHYITTGIGKTGKWTDHYPWLKEIEIPDYVDTVIDIGCGNGRNLAFFENKYKLIGLDIHPAGSIVWVRPLNNMEYHECSYQDLPTYSVKFPLSTSLITTFGSFMYLTKQEQQTFFDYIRLNGCKNALFYEYSDAFLLDKSHFQISHRANKSASKPAYTHLYLGK